MCALIEFSPAAPDSMHRVDRSSLRVQLRQDLLDPVAIRARQQARVAVGVERRFELQDRRGFGSAPSRRARWRSPARSAGSDPRTAARPGGYCSAVVRASAILRSAVCSEVSTELNASTAVAGNCACTSIRATSIPSPACAAVERIQMALHRLRHVAAQLLALDRHLLIGRQQFGTRHQNRIEIAPGRSLRPPPPQPRAAAPIRGAPFAAHRRTDRPRGSTASRSVARRRSSPVST
jgi:hypothetical protein